MRTTAPPINEAVNLLAKYAPGSLRHLRESLPPEMAPVLRAGGVLGVADSLLLPRAKVCREGLSQTIPICTAGITKAEGRLKKSRDFRLASDITAGITSASLVVSFSNIPTVKLLSQIVALIGSLATVGSGFLARIPQDGKMSLFDTYAQLVEARFEAKQLLQEIEIYLGIDLNDEHESALRDLIGKGNLVCQKINSLRTTLLDARAA